MIQELCTKERSELLDELVALWRSSVEATHTFLNAADIERIAAYVPRALQSVQHLAIAKDGQGALLGFIGIDAHTVEMLFVHPDACGGGVGSRLLRYAIGPYGANRVDVNEQNEQAHGFYKHVGFEVVGRSETDDMGEPFPILHMELK